MIYESNLESAARSVTERNLQRLQDILEKAQKSKNISHIANIGYQAGSPVFQMMNLGGAYILILPGFYEVYEHNNFTSNVKYELDNENNLIVKYDGKDYPFVSADDMGSGDLMSHFFAKMLKSEDQLNEEDFIYRKGLNS